MTVTGIPAAGPDGVLRLTWVHVLKHCSCATAGQKARCCS
jgi:hypothetical protein